MATFIEVTNKRTHKLVRLNVDEIQRIDNDIDDGLTLSFKNGDTMVVENTWDDIQHQLA